MSLTREVKVFLDPERYRRLEEEAGRRGSSVGALIRQAVNKEIVKGEETKERKLEAAKRLVSAEEEIPGWKEIEMLIAQGHLNER
ncbi:MAG: hypothetical protein DDT30_01148 [Dehalococcoidia bacterium]|nr:hypothetical protein [Bacillota bacterium]MBT9142956.1 hypothetical protein [Bacillota bacterium]